MMEESESESGGKDFSVEKKLLEWCKERLSGWVSYSFNTVGVGVSTV